MTAIQFGVADRKESFMAMCKDDPHSNDILQPLSLTKLAEYRNACIAKLPNSLLAHRLLLLQERWLTNGYTSNQDIKISEGCKYRVFVHRDVNPDNCTYIAVTENAEHTNVSDLICSIIDFILFI